MIAVNDFVYAKKNLPSVVKNSVGYVKNINIDSDEILVYFIGTKIDVVVKVSDVKKLNRNDLKKSKNGKKICNVCHILKDYYLDFEINQTDAKGLKTTRPSCRNCRKKIDGIKLSKTENDRLNKIKPKNIFTCPICDKSTIPGVTANIVKDHNHTDGTAREWLCDSCNTGLGRFKDDVLLLKKAIEYLEKHDKLK